MTPDQQCCDWKSRAACAQSFARWQQATIAITRRDHSMSSPLASTINCSPGSQALTEVTHQDHSIGITLLLLVRATYIYFCSSRTSGSWWIIQSTQHQQRGCNSISELIGILKWNFHCYDVHSHLGSLRYVRRWVWEIYFRDLSVSFLFSWFSSSFVLRLRTFITHSCSLLFPESG